MIYVRDIGWMLLIGLLLPFWIALAVASTGVIAALDLYWRMRSNTTFVSRPTRRHRQSSADQRSWTRSLRFGSHDAQAAVGSAAPLTAPPETAPTP